MLRMTASRLLGVLTAMLAFSACGTRARMLHAFPVDDNTISSRRLFAIGNYPVINAPPIVARFALVFLGAFRWARGSSSQSREIGTSIAASASRSRRAAVGTSTRLHAASPQKREKAFLQFAPCDQRLSGRSGIAPSQRCFVLGLSAAPARRCAVGLSSSLTCARPPHRLIRHRRNGSPISRRAIRRCALPPKLKPCDRCPCARSACRTF